MQYELIVNLHNSFFFFLCFCNTLHYSVVFAFSLHFANPSNYPVFSFYFTQFFNKLSKNRVPDIFAPAYDLIKKSFDLLLIDVQIQALQLVIQILCLFL